MSEEIEQSGESQEQSSQPEISEEVSDKFAEVFGKMSDSDRAEATDENTSSPKPSARQSAEYARQGRVEEGIEDEDGNEPEESSEPAQEGQEGEEQVEEKPTAEAQEEAKPAADLDPNHVFAAQQLGWTPEKINKLAAADPELAAETLAQLSDTYNTLSRQLLVPGSLVAPGTQTAPQQPAQPQTPTGKLDQFYAKLQEFTEANGEDLGAFAAALRDEVIGPVKQLVAEAEASRESARRTEAVTAMDGLSGKFSDFYGAKDAATNPAQQQARAQLAMLADQLRSGAQAQGRPLSITEAINRAHLIVASQYQRQVVRTEIKNTLQKRQKSITAKPTQRNTPRNSGNAAAEQAIAGFWADKGEVDGL